MPIEALRSSKSPAENAKGATAAVGAMRQAAAGEIARRGPVTVRPAGDGTYEVVDGNATFTAAKRAG